MPSLFKNLLLYRLEHEKWQDLRAQHSQSDFSQYLMLVEKLAVSDVQITGNYRLLITTMQKMSIMISNLVKLFDLISVEEVKNLVQTIPVHIKRIVSNLEKESGIIIKDSEKIKLSPLFVENMIAEHHSPASTARLSRVQALARSPNTIAPELVAELLQGFVNNSITARKRENQDEFKKRRQTWLS